tara:strand:- start:1104 stop:1697 length:594 start_codon:yes stop_codon:yes gene_type:complete
LLKGQKLLLKNKLIRNISFLFVIILFIILIFLLSITKNEDEKSFIKGEMEKFVFSNNKTEDRSIFWFDINNKRIDLTDLNGKVVLVNFWASWCAPCIEELPSINKLSKKIDQSKFESVIINIDKVNKEKSVRIYESLRLDNLKYFYDANNHLVSYLKVDVIPTTIIYSKNGKELGRLIGEAEWSSSDAVKLINYFIK